MKLSEKYSDTKFHESLSSGIQVVRRGQISPSFLQFWECTKNGCSSLKLFTRNLHGPNSECRLRVFVFDACWLIRGHGVIKIMLKITRFEQFHLKNLNKGWSCWYNSEVWLLCHLKTESLNIKHHYVPKYEMLTHFISKLQLQTLAWITT